MEVRKLVYDRKSAAFALSISIRSLDYFVFRKKIGTRRIGREAIIDAAELRRFAASNHFGPINGGGAA